ncbi:MAG: 2-oxoacid:acceptor oxidoreductase family protein, partial [Ignavibacteria bacterium]|nr:2-oxoacid:acceptor oxidoreductase family protein [Ignavibacteria bacterium]
MKEIKILARAGQGAITTATLLGNALFESGKYAYAFPHFGAARMGAAMNAFVRFDDKPVRNRSQITQPDYSVVIDSTLIQGLDIGNLTKDNGIVIINQTNEQKIIKGTNGITIY